MIGDSEMLSAIAYLLWPQPIFGYSTGHEYLADTADVYLGSFF